MANKDTREAGLVFNVNTIKHKLSEFYDSQTIVKPIFGGGQIAIGAVLQKTLELIIRETVKRLPGDGKDKSGVKSINCQALQYGLFLNSGFELYYLAYLKQYDSKQMYKDQIPISKGEMDKFITSIDKDIKLTPDARNLACFCLMKVYNDLAFTCAQFLDFARKRSLDAKCVMFAVTTLFTTNISDVLKADIIKTSKTLGVELDNVGVVETSDTVTTPEVKSIEATDKDETKKSKKTKKITTRAKMAAQIDDETPVDEPESDVLIESDDEKKTEKTKPRKTVKTSSTTARSHK